MNDNQKQNNEQELAEKSVETELAEQSLDALELCQKEVIEWKDKFVRVSADLENYRNRMVREQVVWGDRSQQKVLFELLTVVDNFERALADASAGKQVDEIASHLEGFVLIHTALGKMLTQFSVKEIDADRPFDPEYHEALVHVDSDKHESGAVVDVLQKGYMFKAIVLRPAKVSVAK